MFIFKKINKTFRQKFVDDFLGKNFGYNFPKSSPSFFGKKFDVKKLPEYLSIKQKIKLVVPFQLSELRAFK